MAQTDTYSIKCPKCGAQQDELLYDSIDVGKEPELRRQLLENKLNAVTCQSCGHPFRIDKNLLYHDSRAGWMVYMNPAPMDHYEDAEREFRQVLDDLRSVLPSDGKMPEVDLVLSRIELVERIFVRECELEPRIVEYIKYLIYTQNLDQFLPEDKALLLNGQECTEAQLCFVLQDVESHKLESLMHYKREAYDSLCELMKQDQDLSLPCQLFPGPYISARAYLVNDEV